ncbi:DUF502 domain-containing protein [Paraflavitalea sp. CAU 1676]|uniref:DUF502 domain-containing protein n=1 Tax=Paraflavitalea sp. CAU 1676 TaxID=3032598 RepID=UPI0023DA0F24|nr:DUF502 domain-containing protein [Paraflavitalea sp. CAU 1676]MDF2191594.1 hypothetical protein [Paraflavitalea sp. CAU 1676]
MKKLLRICATTFMGGIFFLVPLVLVIMILEKAVSLLNRIIVPMTRRLEDWKVGGVYFHEILAVMLLLLICLGAGIVARTGLARHLIRRIETRILVHLPGYEVMKSILGDLDPDNTEKDQMKVVLAQTDAGWQLAFLIEQVNEELFVIFIPNAPSLRDGMVVYAEKDKIRPINISRKEAISTIRRMGAGSAKIFRNKGGQPV